MNTRPRSAHLRHLLLALSAFCSVSDRSARAGEVTFRNDVAQVLSKAGCNMGACHGNQNGKGGFRLSLRGQDPEFDFRQLTKQLSGRRINRLDPDRSLILQKPTGRLSHQGGIRFSRSSKPYKILRTWIVQGAPGPKASTPNLLRLEVLPREAVIVAPREAIQLQVFADFDDGTRRDVTDMVVYETSNLLASVNNHGRVQRSRYGQTTIVVRMLQQQVPVRLAFIPRRKDFRWSRPAANNYIDRWIDKRLMRLRINPSALSGDSVFVRRAYLDAIGILPTAAEAKAFVADTRPDKRSRLIDDLLTRSDFADHWALKWSDILRNEEKVLDATGVQKYHAWLKQCMAEGMPINQFVRRLVTATGSTYKEPAANYYRANRDATTRGETTARLFLGARLQCARCHNHPFDRWTQNDYYSWAAVFARIDYKILNNKRRDKFDKNEFVGEQLVVLGKKGSVQNPRSGKKAIPRLLGTDRTVSGGDLMPLGDWLTSPRNRLFAKVQANFIWYHMMGRGLVEPIDDFRVTNPAVHPELLEALGDDFIRSNFDLRHLIRSIMLSRTYQTSAQPNNTNGSDQQNFSRAIVRRLRAEQLLDAQSQVLGVPARFSGYKPGIRAGQIPGVRKMRRRSAPPAAGDRFLSMFGKPERLLACECERSDETTLGQALVLTADDSMNRRFTDPQGRLKQLADSTLSNGEMVRELFWIALARAPQASERRGMIDYVRQLQTDPQQENPRWIAAQDIAWALMNSKEFLFRH